MGNILLWTYKKGSSLALHLDLCYCYKERCLDLCLAIRCWQYKPSVLCQYLGVGGKGYLSHIFPKVFFLAPIIICSEWTLPNKKPSWSFWYKTPGKLGICLRCHCWDGDNGSFFLKVMDCVYISRLSSEDHSDPWLVVAVTFFAWLSLGLKFTMKYNNKKEEEEK